jgi:CHASE2 domain-containing sensor protein
MTSQRQRAALATVAAVACLVTLALTVAGVQSPLRVAAVVVTLALAPGAALLSVATPRSHPLELGLVVGVSLAVITLGAQLSLWLGEWDPERAVAVVAAVAVSVLVWRLARGTQ